jgi:FK506-binding nuclear protein
VCSPPRRSTVVPAGEEPIEVQLVADVRITNAALGETLVDENGRTTLKIVYRPPKAERMLEKGEDMDEEEEEDDEDDSDDEEPKEVVLCSLTPGKVRFSIVLCVADLTAVAAQIEQTTMDLILEANTAYLFEAVGKKCVRSSPRRA